MPGDPGASPAPCWGWSAVGFSLYLTYLELFVIDAICQWCVASAVVMTALAALTADPASRAAPTSA